MKDEIVDIECDLENIFSPPFFDIIIHLTIHLVYEMNLGGPAHFRWMYSAERTMCQFKALVHN